MASGPWGSNTSIRLITQVSTGSGRLLLSLVLREPILQLEAHEARLCLADHSNFNDLSSHLGDLPVMQILES